MTDTINLPEDTKKSRLQKAPRPSESLDDVATAGERIEAFWEKYPEGSILTEIEARQATTADTLPYSVYTARVFVRRNADAESPDATAHATRSEADSDPITAAFAQETAETSAVSRALRNIGILPTSKRTDAVPEQTLAASKQAISSVASARRAAGMTQPELATRMRDNGFPWTQSLISKVERGHRPITPAESVVLAHLIGYEDTPESP